MSDKIQKEPGVLPGTSPVPGPSFSESGKGFKPYESNQLNQAHTGNVETNQTAPICWGPDACVPKDESNPEASNNLKAVVYVKCMETDQWIPKVFDKSMISSGNNDSNGNRGTGNKGKEEDHNDTKEASKALSGENMSMGEKNLGKELQENAVGEDMQQRQMLEEQQPQKPVQPEEQPEIQPERQAEEQPQVQPIGQAEEQPEIQPIGQAEELPEIQHVRQRERQLVNQVEIQPVRQRERQLARQRERQLARQRERQLARQRERQPERQRERHAERQRERQPERQRERQPERQPERQNNLRPEVDDWELPIQPESENARVHSYVPVLDFEKDLFVGDVAHGFDFDNSDDFEIVVSGEDIPPKINSFEDIEIEQLLARNIRRCGIVKLTPVQKYALPIIMNGRDLVSCAQTGSGKMIAYLIPIIHRILTGEECSMKSNMTVTPQLVIVTPTRKLAVQIFFELKKLTYGSKLVTQIIQAGTALETVAGKMKDGCNILVANPRHLLYGLDHKMVTLRELRHFVVHDIDGLTEWDFTGCVLLEHCTMNFNRYPQVVVFSSTLTEGIKTIGPRFLKNRIFLAMGLIAEVCRHIEQRVIFIPKFNKIEKLLTIFKQLNRTRTVIFVNKDKTADILAAFLSEKGYCAVPIHGSCDKDWKEEMLIRFRAGFVQVLVATAKASRELAVRGLNYVINYDMPQIVDEYIQRIGRTGRAGNRGLAITFYDPGCDTSVAPALAKVLEVTNQRIPPFLRAYLSDDYNQEKAATYNQN